MAALSMEDGCEFGTEGPRAPQLLRQGVIPPAGAEREAGPGHPRAVPPCSRVLREELR